MRILAGFLAVAALLGAGAPAQGTPCGSGSVSWVASDFFDRAAKDWRMGMGFDLSASLCLAPKLDLRGDWGLRWADGTHQMITSTTPRPDWGGAPGYVTERLRTMPLTCDLIYRPGCCCRSACAPYIGAGLGFYDLQAKLRRGDTIPENQKMGDADDVVAGEREIIGDIYRFGWNARVGARFHRTSGLFVQVESALHYVELPGHWTPAYDVSLGFGTNFPRP
jgi:hypothetical protein